MCLHDFCIFRIKEKQKFLKLAIQNQIDTFMMMGFKCLSWLCQEMKA
jgi:hypothetical protein